MIKAIGLIGSKESKRTEYFLKAAKELNVPIDFYDLKSIGTFEIENKNVKIDPNIVNSSNIAHIDMYVQEYIKKLKIIDKSSDVKFLNTPNGIVDLLDKKKCKTILENFNIPVTPILEIGAKTYIEFKEELVYKKSYNIFLKPNLGSGAAGIMAYRYNKINNREVLYTSIEYNKKLNCFSNKKKITVYRDSNEIKKFIEFSIKNRYIAEKWISKDTFKSFSYDIRMMVQFGKVEFRIIRASKSPITNLHLNNKGMDFSELNFSEKTKANIEKLGLDVMNVLKHRGLNSIGIDLLLSSGSLDPYIIEVNGQGDLIYKDIYDENKIYKNQILEMIKN